MDKLLEKKNLGISATLLAVFAYFLGYYISISYAGFLVAFIFAAVVFALNFDDKVKTAIKQSYILGLFFCLIYLGLAIINEMSVLFQRIHVLNTVFNNIHVYLTALFNILVIAVFALLAIMALFKKDVKINFILNILGEGTPKPQPVYQQPVPQPQPYQQPMYQQPVPPQQAPNQAAQPAVVCPKCQTSNHPGAVFCASCGNKLS